MQLSALVAVGLSAVLASCSARGRGYEATAMFQLYRIEYAAFGTNSQLAPGCQHPCSFDDFIRHISRTPAHYIGPPTPFSDPHNPTVDETKGVTDWPGNSPNKAKQVSSYTNQYFPERVCGGIPGCDASTRHGDVMALMNQRAEDALTADPNAGANRLQKVTDCMELIREFRKADQAKGLFGDIRAELKARAMTAINIETVVKNLPDGTTFREVDMQKTLDNVANSEFGGNGVPKPQCWEHGCNGRQFSSFSNLLRHRRDINPLCPHCGAEFSRVTARNGHLLQDKCKR
jgi:hypothetical protein